MSGKHVLSLRGPAADYDAAEARRKNELGIRLAAERKRQGLTLQAFSGLLAACGVQASVSAVSKWESGLTTPDAYQFLCAARVLGIPDLSYFTGRSSGGLNAQGLRKLREYESDLLATGLYAAAPPKPRLRAMPVSTLAVSAGPGAFLDEGSFETEEFPEDSIPAGADFGVRVRGDSMEPTFHNGQVVWVRRCGQVPCGKPGVFVYDGEGYLKIYEEQDPADPEASVDSMGVLHRQPVLVSCNPRYAPRPVRPGAEFRVIGAVVT